MLLVSEPSPQTGPVQLRLVPPTDIGDTSAYYSNFVQATASPHDVTLHFGWYATPPFTEPPEGIVDVPVRALLKVSLPLNLVPGIIQILESQLDVWRKTFGEPALEQLGVPQTGEAPVEQR